MALTVTQMATIQSEVMLDIDPTIKTKEALEFREIIAEEIAELRKRGIVPELPKEWPEEPTAAEKREIRKLAKRVYPEFYS